jgi:hypothetical protein
MTMTVSEEKQAANIMVIYHGEIKGKSVQASRSMARNGEFTRADSGVPLQDLKHVCEVVDQGGKHCLSLLGRAQRRPITPLRVYSPIPVVSRWRRSSATQSAAW